jgi:hypothetical protein
MIETTNGKLGKDVDHVTTNHEVASSNLAGQDNYNARTIGILVDGRFILWGRKIALAAHQWPIRREK